MQRKVVKSGSIYEELAGYVRAVEIDGRIYVSGTVGCDFTTGYIPPDCTEQTEQALHNIENALYELNASLQNIVSVKAYVPNKADVIPVSTVLKHYLEPIGVTNTTLCTPLAADEACRVELEVVAVKEQSSSPSVLSTTDETDCASILCDRPAPEVFAFMQDGHKLGQWALGCWNTVEPQPGLYRGTSLIDQQVVWVRIDALLSTGMISYHVGSTPDALQPRIMAKVVPGEILGRPASSSLLSLLAWRDASMDDDRWQQLRDCHRVELRIIRNLLQAEPASDLEK